MEVIGNDYDGMIVRSYGASRNGNYKYDVDKIIKESLSEKSQYCFVEKKTEYYKCMWDFDYKDNMNEICKEKHDEITNIIIKEIINAFKQLFTKVNELSLQYIYCIKNQGLGVHVYFPDIILKKEVHIEIYNIFIKNIKTIYKKEKHIYENITKILDLSTCNANGLRLIYNKYNGRFYYPCNVKSKYEIPETKEEQLKLTLINILETSVSQETLTMLKKYGCNLERKLNIAAMIDSDDEIDDKKNNVIINKKQKNIKMVYNDDEIKTKNNDVILNKKNVKMVEIDDEENILLDANKTDGNAENNAKRVRNLDELKKKLAIPFATQIKELLAIIQEQNQHYKSWIDIGLYLFTISNSLDMLKIWYNWSSVKYEAKEEEHIEKWKSFKRNIKPSEWGFYNLRNYIKKINNDGYNKFYENNLFERTTDLVKKNTQYDIAKFFYSLKPDNYIFSNDVWYRLNINNVWEQMTATAINIIIFDITATIENELDDHKNFLKSNDVLIKKNYDLSCKIGNSSFISGSINYLQTLYYKKHMEFDLNGYILPFDNCLYDLKLHTFRNIKPDDYVSKTTGYDWKEPIKEDVALIKDLFAKIQPNIEYRNCFMDILCSGLYGLIIQKFFMFKGEGGNGKSLMDNIMLKALGNFAHVLNINVLCHEIKSGCANPDIANLSGKRFVITRESSENIPLCNATLRDLTGSGTVSARILYSNNDQTNLVGTIVSEGNNYLKFKSQIMLAEFRRIVLLLFSSVFTEIDSLIDNISVFKSVSEYSQAHFIDNIKTALLTVLFEHNKTHYKGDVYIPQSVQNDTNNMLTSGNDFLVWFNENYDYVKDSDERTYTIISEIYNNFKASDCYLNMKNKFTSITVKQTFSSHPVFKKHFRETSNTTYKGERFTPTTRMQGYKLKREIAVNGLN